MKVILLLSATTLAATLPSFDERAAQAQVPAAVYDDVKTRSRTSSKRTLRRPSSPTSRARRSITLVYFPNTLQRVYDRQFGSLQSAVQTDAAELAGSLVYYALKQNVVNPVDLVKEFIASEETQTITPSNGKQVALLDPSRRSATPPASRSLSTAPPARSPLQRTSKVFSTDRVPATSRFRATSVARRRSWLPATR